MVLAEFRQGIIIEIFFTFILPSSVYALILTIFMPLAERIRKKKSKNKFFNSQKSRIARF